MGERDARERFARAVEREALPFNDEEFSDELAVVAALRQEGATTETGERTRHNVAARIAMRTAEPEPREPEPPHRHRPRRRSVVGATLAAALCLLAGLGTFALTLSDDALPGDTLYSVKHTRESAVLAVTFDDAERAERRLRYAATRLDELSRLVERPTQARERAYANGLADFDHAVRAAASTLTTLATRSSPTRLDTLSSWADKHAGEIGELTPPPGLAARHADSAVMVENVTRRADALRARFDCYRITSGESDALGVLPATGQCRHADSDPSAPPPEDGPTSPSTPPEDGTDEASRDEPEDVRVEHQRSDSATVAPPTTAVPEYESLSFDNVTPEPVPDPVRRPRLPTDPGHGPASALSPVDNLLSDLLSTRQS